MSSSFCGDDIISFCWGGVVISFLGALLLVCTANRFRPRPYIRQLTPTPTPTHPPPRYNDDDRRAGAALPGQQALRAGARGVPHPRGEGAVFILQKTLASPIQSVVCFVCGYVGGSFLACGLTRRFAVYIHIHTHTHLHTGRAAHPQHAQERSRSRQQVRSRGGGTAEYCLDDG